MVDAVIFDMDGVIFDSEKVVVRSWKEVAERHGIPDIEATVRSCLGTNYAASRERFKEKYGADFPYDIYKKEAAALFHVWCGGGRLPKKPGIAELLTYLRKKGIRTAVASSTRAELVRRELADGGLLSLFDCVIGGDMVEHSKPEPDIFLRVCEELGARPGESYVIEDSYNGIRAAHRAGMRPVMVPDLAEPTPEMERLAACILPSLVEVRAFLAALLGDIDCAVERFAAEVSVEEYLETCVDVPTFLGYCRECPNYQKTWSCPEFDFDPMEYWKKYRTLRLYSVKIHLPEMLVQYSFAQPEREALTDQIIRHYKKSMGDELLALEAEEPGSISLSGGYCTQCGTAGGCTRRSGQPCRYPERMRYSIEALGGNVGLTVTKYLRQKLLWIEEGRLPEYYMLVLGLLVP